MDTHIFRVQMRINLHRNSDERDLLSPNFSVNSFLHLLFRLAVESMENVCVSESTINTFFHIINDCTAHILGGGGL